jgi:hypothetical protein
MFFIELPSTMDWAMESFGVARKDAYDLRPEPSMRDMSMCSMTGMSRCGGSGVRMHQRARRCVH